MLVNAHDTKRAAHIGDNHVKVGVFKSRKMRKVEEALEHKSSILSFKKKKNVFHSGIFQECST